MMELTTCAFIVTFVSLVTATPYGYGVKGGAGASNTAESSAPAHSFENRGDIPLGVPFGNTFSGSFSKSSSSSSSSSSASSSSNSGSFSFNSGSGSFLSPGTNGNAGCSSGTCQNAGHQGPISGYSDFHGLNAANSATEAGSGGTSEVNCQGSQCDFNSGKCSSGLCQPQLPTESSKTGYDSGNKCSSGQCGSTSPSGPSQYDDSDDIHFVAQSSKAVHDSKEHSLNDKTKVYTAGSDCQNGNCGPTTLNTLPAVAHESSKPYPVNSNSEVTPGYNVPATHLETPNLNSGCNSGICQTGHDNLPSSYNVPIHGSPAGCSAPGCTSDFSSPPVNQQLQYDTSEKKQPTYTGGFGGPIGILKPDEFNIPISTTSKPVSITNPTQSTSPNFVLDCKTSHCIGSPTMVGATSTPAQFGSYGGSVTASSNKPIYTGGFGGPSSMLKPDKYNVKVPVYSSSPSYNNHSPTSSVGCTKPNCNGYATKPNTGSESSSELPPYTGGFGGPPGVLKPNEFNVPYSASNIHPSNAAGITPQPTFGVPKPITVPSPSFSGSTSNYRPIGITYSGAPAVAPITPSYTITQPLRPTDISSAECKTGNCATYPGSGTIFSTPSGSYGSSVGCITGNCSSYPPTVADISAPTEPYGNSAICKTGNCAGHPNSGSGAKTETNDNASSGLYGHSAECKTGNCGIPTNVVPSVPHGAAYPNTALEQFSPQYTGGSGGPSNTVLPSGVGSTNCKSSNCADSVPANSGANVQSGSYSGSKAQLPVYTGGFGGPAGLLKPNDYSRPDITASSNKPLPGPLTSIACSSRNCNPKEASPSPGWHNAGLNGAHVTASSSASANAVAYSGGFGGPPGFLIPYDSGKVDLTKIAEEENKGTHTGRVNTLSTVGSQGGSAVGTTAVSGSIASANSGSFAYNMQGNGIKGASPCSAGCGGGYQNGLQGSLSSAAAKSISSSGAHGVGGTFASSSASAHSSAGAYTKGGYGKR